MAQPVASVLTTLTALQTAFQAALPSAVTVVNRSPGVPMSLKLPGVAIHPMHDVIEDIESGTMRNPDDEPNIYSFIYLEQLLRQQSADLSAVETRIYTNMEALKNYFRLMQNKNLPDGSGQPQVLAAGQRIVIDYDQDGPYVQYMDGIYLGCRGTITVAELIRYTY